VLSYEQAEAKARAMVATPGGGKIERITVRQAVGLYDTAKRDAGLPPADPGKLVHILPPLGDLVIAELTVEQLSKWRAALAASPAQTRPRAGKIQFKAAPQGEEAIRRRKATTNRVVALLKAILNHAYDAGHVANRDAWGRKFKKYKGVDRARVRFLTSVRAHRAMALNPIGLWCRCGNRVACAKCGAKPFVLACQPFMAVHAGSFRQYLRPAGPSRGDASSSLLS
jgi:hypothetical protein